MTKEEKKQKKAEKAKLLMPKWIRRLLILGALVSAVAAYVLAIIGQTKWTEWMLLSPNFTDVDISASIPFIVLALVCVIVNFVLFVLHFVLPKAVFKKKIAVKNVVFTSLLLIVSFFAGIMSISVTPKSVMSISEIEYLAGSGSTAYATAGDVSKYIKNDNTIVQFLDSNSSLKCIVSGIKGESTTSNFSSHPHKAYTTQSSFNSKIVICDFYLGDIDTSSLTSSLVSYSMPSDKSLNQEIWVTYGSSYVTTAGYYVYSQIVPNFTKTISNGNAALLLDETNNGNENINLY